MDWLLLLFNMIYFATGMALGALITLAFTHIHF